MRSRHRPLRPAEVGGQAARAGRFWDRFYAPQTTVIEPDDVLGNEVLSESDGLSAVSLETKTLQADVTEWISNPTRLLPVILDAVKDCTPSTVLEIGCGDSSLAAQLYDALGGHAVVTAIDVSEVALTRSRKAFCGPRPGLCFMHADATNLAGVFADSSIDLIVDKGMSDTLQFRAKTKQSRALRRALFAQVFRMLVPGGVFILTTPKVKPQYLGTVPWASVTRFQLEKPEGVLVDLASRGTATTPAQSAHVFVCRKPCTDATVNAAK